MISQTAAKAAISVAQQFDARKMVLAAAPGTPLAALCNTATATTNALGINEEYTPDPADIEATAAGFATDGSSMHDVQLATMAAEIATAVTQHLYFAKNVVRPIISELVESVTADIAALPTTLQYNRNIVPYKLPEPCKSSALLDQVAEFGDVSYEALRKYIPLPMLGGEEIVKNMITGAGDTDDMIQTWAVSKGFPFLESVWRAVFSAEESAVRFDQLIQSNTDGFDAAIVVFLIAKRIYNEPSGSVDMSLNEYNLTVADLRNQAALRILTGVEAYNRAVKAGHLIQRIEDEQIIVNADVYDKYLEEGGQASIILGSVLSDRPARFVAELNTRAVEYVALWEQTNRMLTITERNKRFARFQDILRSRGESIITNNMATIFGTVVAEGQKVDATLPEYRKALVELNKMLVEVREDDFSEIWKLATRLVCRSAFYFTDAEKILTGIDQAVKDNPGIEVREAALLSMLEYVTDFISNQLVVSDIT